MHRGGCGRTFRLFPRGCAVGCGQRELNDRAAFARIDDVDGAAVELDGQLAEGQAEAGASAASPCTLIEPVEDVGSVVRVDAGPVSRTRITIDDSSMRSRALSTLT